MKNPVAKRKLTRHPSPNPRVYSHEAAARAARNSLRVLWEACWRRDLWAAHRKAGAPFDVFGHPALLVPVPATLVLPWHEDPQPVKVLRTVCAYPYYHNLDSPLIVVRWLVDGMGFWGQHSPWADVQKTQRAAAHKLLCQQDAAALAPRRNDELSFLPGQAREVAEWLADLLVTGKEVPHSHWWPGASEAVSRAREDIL